MTFNIGAFMGELDSLKRASDAAAAEAARERQAAAEAEEAAQRQAEAAVVAERIAERTSAGAFLAQMRALTDEVRQARARAVEAVRDGGDVAGAWIAYRKVRAANQATWHALSYPFIRAVGREQPPGEWGPTLRPDRSSPYAPETFSEFVTAAMAELENEIDEGVKTATRDAVEQARAAAEAASKARQAKATVGRAG